MGIIKHDHDEIFRLLDSDSGKAAQPHQHVAITWNRDHAALWPRQRQPERDHRGAAHGAP
jgi:hypothetical protein